MVNLTILKSKTRLKPRYKRDNFFLFIFGKPIVDCVPNWILKCPIFTLNTRGWANSENFRGVLITMSLK